MTEEQVRALFEEARAQTSAKEAEITFLAARGDSWTLLVRAPGSEELAIHVDPGADAGAESMREQIQDQLMRLF